MWAGDMAKESADCVGQFGHVSNPSDGRDRWAFILNSTIRLGKPLLSCPMPPSTCCIIVVCDSLTVAFRTTLEANGWQYLSSTTTAEKGTTQVYDKAGSSLQVLIYEGWYYTWVELSATRLVSKEPAAAR
jgi:hypothetical protein